ncbi:MAG TPA: hypothetical protein VHV78_11970 [Gemmatimonadaceae bacterium]|nr:hypothetical protein [Gemmatimonadaceae bacterium]
MITIVEAPLRNGETVMAGFQRKERELAELFATLPLVESRARHARLCAAEKNDPVAAAFARLTAERQHRLLGFLADARRRAAIASARR